MKKNSETKLLIALLLIYILLSLIYTHRVMATNSKLDDVQVVTKNIIVNESKLSQNLNAKEEKIMKYDAITGETTEVDMDSLRQALVSSYAIKGVIPNYTEPCNPYTEVDSLNSTNATRGALIQVLSSSAVPYRATCRLTWDNYGNTDLGSGFLVSSKLLLTSAHCVMNMEDSDRFFSQWVAAPGYSNGSSYKNLSSGWSSVYYSSNWKSTHSADYDWCLVVLSSNLGSQVGWWYGCQAYGTNAEMNGVSVKTLGYPGALSSGEYQYTSSGTISNTQDRRFDSSTTIREGMSGGPYYRSDNYAVGIIRAYYISNPSVSIGTRITQDIINLILQNA